MYAYLKELDKALEQEQNEKVKKAIQLFIRVDANMKNVVLYASGFSGIITAKNIREHFENMDLMDALDSAIEDMEWDLEN